jgi:hypothetical protein
MSSPSTRVVALVLALILGLSACGGEQAATSTPVGGTFDAPTATRSGFGETNVQTTPVVADEATSEATAVVLSETAPEATAVVLGDDSTTTNDGMLETVVIASLETYTHDTGLFSIDVPSNWTITDNSTAEEAILVWSDPSENGALIVDVFEDENSYSAEELVEILRTFLNDSFSSEPEFSIDEPVAQEDGSQLIVWGYTATASNNIQAELLGNSFIEQRGNKVSLLTALLPADQFDVLQADAETILNSYSLNPEAGLGDGVAESPGEDAAVSDAEGLPATIIGVGEPYTIGAVELVVHGSQDLEGSEFFQPDEGNRFYVVDVSVTNVSDSETVVSSLLQMTLFDSQGNSYDIDLIAATLAENSIDGDIAPGATLTGYAAFQIPLDASGLIFVYDDLIEGDVGVALQ